MCMSNQIKNYEGKNNPFYGKHHTEESKKKIGAAIHDYSGKNNPMYGRTNYDVWVFKYGKKIADLKQQESNEKNRISNLGERNGFYGKTHTKDTINTIILKNKQYRELNKERIYSEGMRKLDLTLDILKESFEYYKDHICNFEILKEKFKIKCDKRILKKYWIITNVVNPIEMRRITKLKQFLSPETKTKSAIEIKIHELLSNKYGKNNVNSSYVIFPYPYVYDIILFDKILIEYDGYYWHEERKSKNDDIKTKLAFDNGFILYRIKEDIKRKIDIKKEFDIIDELVNKYKI